MGRASAGFGRAWVIWDDMGILRQTACKPGSVLPRKGVTTIHLGRPLPDASRDRPGRRRGNAFRPWPRPRTVPSLFGLAPGGVYRAASVAGRAVRSYRTLSPLPSARPEPGRRRFAFCGTFPRVAPAGRYPAPCFRGARTFLPPGEPERRPSGRLTRAQCRACGAQVKRHARMTLSKRKDLRIAEVFIDAVLWFAPVKPGFIRTACRSRPG